MADEEEEFLDPTVQNLLDQKSLKMIFLSGKGGTGKTTSTCTIATLMSTVREKVLIVSTDPAHNLSDAFCQKFTHEPTLVNGFSNLFAMEVEPQSMAEAQQTDNLGLGEESAMQNMMKEIGSAMPGIDEAMSFAEIMKNVQKMDYDVILFDTAPTGHTLRLLRFPTTLSSAFEKVMELKNKYGGILNQAATMMGQDSSAVEGQILGKLEETQRVIAEVNTMFRDPELTTFVCVCIPEFLSVYETERLVQELTKYEIDVHNIIVNQVLFAEPDACRKLLARKRMQDKYLNQIHALYAEDMHVTVLPILDNEVRSVDSLKAFSQYMINPYRPKKTVDGVASSPQVVKFLIDKFALEKEKVYEELEKEGLTVPKV